MGAGRRIGLIAGAGRFPFHVAQEAKRQGVAVDAVGLSGWVDPALASQVDTYEELAVGQLGRLMASLTSRGVREAVMAGKVTKQALLDQRASLDEEARRLLAQAREVSVPAILGAIAARLAQEGIALLDSSTFLKPNLCPVGVLTVRRPTSAEQADVQVGLSAARAIAAMDIGQTVAVKGRVVVAVEALEGTDATIRRARALAGSGLVVVKTAAPAQDRRFDLPVVGMDTIRALQDAQAGCLAMEAGTTLLLERDALIAAANAARLCLLGVKSV